MSDPIEKSKQDFDGWLEKWDSALEKGIFGDAPKPPSASKYTSDESFFGLRQDNPTDGIDQADSQYWRAINSVADGGVDVQRLDEADAVSLNVPNPIRKSTEGKDQNLDSKALNATFSEEDILELEEMKKKLHELESKAAAMDGKDQKSQIESMIKKIDELSDKLGRTDG
jgi:hypothetical protein